MSDEESLLRALDGELAADERQQLLERLRHDPALASALREQVQVEHLLQQIHAEADGFTEAVLAARRRSTDAFVARVVAGHSRRRRAAHRGWWLAAGLAAALVAAVMLIHRFLPSPSLWQPVQSEGLHVDTASGWRQYQADRPLRNGDRLRILGQRGLRFQQADGSAAQFAQGSEITIRPYGFDLLRGAIDASLRPRQEVPFTIDTRQARVEVLGTRYHLAVAGDTAELVVDEGAVLVRHQRGQRRVAAEHLLRWTERGAVMAYAVRDTEQLFHHSWRETLPHDDAVGLIDADAGLCRPVFGFDDRDGNRLERISSGYFRRGQLGSHHPDDRLHIEARFETPGWMVVLIGLRRHEHDYNAVYTAPTVPDGAGWQTLSIPLRRFRSVKEGDIAVGDDYHMYVFLPLQDSGMELRSVAITRSRHEPVATEWARARSGSGQGGE